MSLRIRFGYSSGASLGYSVERLRDGLYYDFADGTFKATPTTQVAGLASGTGNYVGLYTATLSPTPASQFTDGNYAIYIHNTAASNAVFSMLGASMFGG